MKTNARDRSRFGKASTVRSILSPGRMNRAAQRGPLRGAVFGQFSNLQSARSSHRYRDYPASAEDTPFQTGDGTRLDVELRAA
ncbi:MAG TPA: hypothetical protein VFG23_20435 [Polyangia bacterium]|nr:hypothetical protein [Polyangia bacterium]